MAIVALLGSFFSTELTVGCELTCGVESASTLDLKSIFNFESTIGFDLCVFDSKPSSSTLSLSAASPLPSLDKARGR
jgi:hypothetical protein